MKKVVHVFVGLLFAIFALVQINDPDYYIWIWPYLAVTVFAFNEAFSLRKSGFWPLVFAIIIGAWFVTYIPHLMQWFKDDMPNIAGSMKAGTPYIELVRESMGLLMCIIALIYYGRSSKK